MEPKKDEPHAHEKGAAVKHPHQESASLVLDEMRTEFERQTAAGASLDGKANLLLTAATGMITVFGILGVALHAGKTMSFWFPLAALAAFIAFGLLVYFSVMAYGPRRFNTPLAADWERLRTDIVDAETLRAYQIVVKAYAHVIHENEIVLESKASYLRYGLVALIAIVLLLLLLAWVGTALSP